MDAIIQWLMEGDVSIQYQVSRDLLMAESDHLTVLQNRVASEGWGARFLEKRHPNGHWGKAFYEPRWISTHHTLLDLKTIGLPPNHKEAQESTEMVLQEPTGINGGINYAHTIKFSDVCINGMILNFSSYFLPNHPRLIEIVDFLLQVQMSDGGWNCRYLNKKTIHSSVHSTLSVLEGLLQFRKSGSEHRLKEIIGAEKRALEFLLKHKLYQSHRTGETIDRRMLMLSFPCRWRYDILRALDYFRDAGVEYDARMNAAMEIIKSKKRKDGRWPVQEKHKGQVHFDMEQTGGASRWNTLRALRVLKGYDSKYYNNL